MSDPVKLPAVDCDLLTGVEQIAAWFGITDGQARVRITEGLIKTFRLRAHTTIYALKSENNAAWRAAAKASLTAVANQSEAA